MKWIDHDVAGIGDAECVAVGRRLGDRVHRDVAAGADLLSITTVWPLRPSRRRRKCGRKESVTPPAEVDTMT